MQSPQDQEVAHSPTNCLQLQAKHAFVPGHFIESRIAKYPGQVIEHRSVASEITTLTTEYAYNVRVEKCLSEYWGEHHRLLFWRAMLLDLVTGSLEREELKKLSWLTIEVLRLPANHVFAVAEALYQRRWQQAKDPFAYVCKVASNIYRSDYDTRIVGADLAFDLVHTHDINLRRHYPAKMAEVEVLFDLHEALRKLRLPDDVVELYRAAYHGITPSRVAGDLGWTLRRLRTARKGFDRAKEQVRAALSDYVVKPLGEDWNTQPNNRKGRFEGARES